MRKRDFPTMLLYGLGFLLLWEWLLPVEKLTETDHIEVFIIFLVLSFVMSFFKVKWIPSVSIKAVYILGWIHHLYYEGGLFQFNWLPAFAADINHNIGLVFARNWDELSYEFRTFLLFILLWLMVYLIHYWLMRQQQIFIFFFMTLIYITVLDTFTIYDAQMAIIRTVTAGFIVMGMLAFYRLIDREKLNKHTTLLKKWMVPLAGMIAVSVFIGIIVPKAAPVWPDPVPYLKAAKDGVSNNRKNGPSRIGYGTNDDRLGGPFIGDDRIVFTVEAASKNYWKVETKDVYTGKGWLSSGSTPIEILEGELIPIYSIPSEVDRAEESARIFPVNTKQPFIVYPLGIQKIDDIKPVSPYEGMLRIDTTLERIATFEAEEYTVHFGVPKYKIEDLRKIRKFNRDEMGEDFYNAYTLLPKNLPPRIKRLTEEITAEKTNWFDKAKAVEAYFSTSEYSYDQKDVALPEKDDDYVDQFLFETKRGYCDNFSTAMAVMLRTVGIPTRWVKGFTGGEFEANSRDDNTKKVYEITNNNAHSWVEVFLPNQGWIPFEPTKGYANELQIDYGTSQSSTPTQSGTQAPVQKPQEQPIEETKQSTDKADKFDLKLLWLKVKYSFLEHWKRVVLLILLAAMIAGLLYRFRGKWLPYLILVRYRFKQEDETIATAYLMLLRQLDRYGLKRKENQTLRSYAQYIDYFFSTREMSRLTHCYEQYLYHQELPNGTWKENRELWENLIKRTIA
ncbi:transglutaminase TgpA family protein [Bacillus rubiinfantis]|uniref:transglutaminase TgpA family protein n=1 Tax=Bacillus rubiinfantis TaxID=1499680 RepID=UPI0005A7606B|nr:transglutaminaseTgpA domain-containing protein [Bacillus rubiinfantis]